MKAIRAAALVGIVLAGCGGQPPEADTATSEEALTAQECTGATLFATETFRGNGRTCLTCHSAGTGTVSPKDVEERFNNIENGTIDSLFRSIDSDTGTGSSYTRLRTRATIRVTIPLPSRIRLANNPSATTVTFARGIPTTLNIGLDPELMYDGRAHGLVDQANGAIRAHFQPGRAATTTELSAIAAFEKTLFSSRAMQAYSKGGPAPVLPAGGTASEKRGRTVFDNNCGFCHGGPLLDSPDPTSDSGPVRFSNVQVSEFNEGNLPNLKWLVTNTDGTKSILYSPDPGRALILNDPNNDHWNEFKTPSLLNIKNTAPYFHDNSSLTLQDVANHYSRFNALFQPPFTEQEKSDLVAFLKLL